MSMRCKQCAEGFPKGQQYTVFELRRNVVMPIDVDSQTTNVMLEDSGVFCSRKCLGDYLKSGDRSGVFDLGGKKPML
jgi:hypothetical protein